MAPVIVTDQNSSNSELTQIACTRLGQGPGPGPGPAPGPGPVTPVGPVGQGPGQGPGPGPDRGDSWSKCAYPRTFRHRSGFPKSLVGGIILDSSLEEIVLVLGKVSEKWGLPKGHKELGEGFLNGALREIREETGLQIELMIPILPYITSRKARLYLLSLPKELCQFQIQDVEEILDVKWVPIKDLPELYNKTRMLKNIMPRLDYVKEKIMLNFVNYIPTRIYRPNSNGPRFMILNKFLFQILSIMIKYQGAERLGLREMVARIKKNFPQVFNELDLYKVVKNFLIRGSPPLHNIRESILEEYQSDNNMSQLSENSYGWTIQTRSRYQKIKSKPRKSFSI